MFLCAVYFFPSSHGSTSLVSFRCIGLSYQDVLLVRRRIVQYVTSLCNQEVISVCPRSCHNMNRCRSRNSLARFGSTSLRQFLWRLEVGSVNACNLTMRAADKCESARFKAWFWNWMSWRSGKPVWLEEQGVGLFLAGSWSGSIGIFSSRPLAANASRWAAKDLKYSKRSSCTVIESAKR